MGAPLERAVAEHLRRPRTRSARVLGDWAPPYPSHVARFAPEIERVASVTFGAQGLHAVAAVAELLSALRGHHGAGHAERAVSSDDGGQTQLVSAWWADADDFEQWYAGAGTHWLDGAGVGGRFVEAVLPSVRRLETLHSTPDPDGIATVADGLSGPVREHGYWGSARERVPLARTDALAPHGEVAAHVSGRRAWVVLPASSCVIRSAQDWGASPELERRRYLEQIEPRLAGAMAALTRDGAPVGCLANRYARVLDADGAPTSRAWAASWWRSLAALERWAETHPAHLVAFAASRSTPSVRLHHELAVPDAGEHWAEYVGCRPRTGLLPLLDGTAVRA